MQSTIKQRMISLLAIVAIVGSAMVVLGKADDAEAALKWSESVKATKTTKDKKVCDPTITVCP